MPGKEAPASPQRPPRLLYLRLYLVYVVLAALDVTLTHIVLNTFEGHELNIVADWVLRWGRTPGLAALKLSSVTVVVTICEVVGRRRYGVGRKLVEWAVAINAIPVIVAAFQILYWLL